MKWSLIALTASLAVLPAKQPLVIIDEAPPVDAPCGTCLDYYYESTTGLYPSFFSHTFGGGGDESLASAPIRGTSNTFAKFAKNDRSNDANLVSSTAPAPFSLADGGCPTAGEQTCTHWGSVNSECNLPTPHGCHSHIGANSCHSSHLPCKPYGYPESDLAVLTKSTSVKDLAKSFANIAHARPFTVEHGELQFIGCNGLVERSLDLRPALVAAVEQVLREGLVLAKPSGEQPGLLASRNEEFADRQR